MIHFVNSLRAWGTDRFADTLKSEIERLSGEQLCLQRGMSSGSYALDDNIKAMIIRVTDDGDRIHATAGIFYAGIIAGCSCADDPTPIDAHHEYCELLLVINKTTAATTIALLPETST